MNRSILVLGASKHQVPVIMAACSLGLTVHVVDNLPDNPGHFIGNFSYNVDTTDMLAIENLVSSIELNAVISPCTDVAVETAARVASILELPGVSLESARILTSKIAFREFQKQNDIRFPDFVEVRNRKNECLSVGFGPGVVKPDRSSGSKGIVITDIGSYVFSDQVQAASDFSINSKVLFEELLIGEQLTVEGVLVDGKVELSFILDRATAAAPYVCTYGHSWPSNVEEEAQEEILREIEITFSKLNINTTVFDADLVWSNGRPYIIELSPRLGGNSISKLVKLACGIDLPKIAVELALGERPNLEVNEFSVASSVVLLGVMNSGIVEIDDNVLQQISRLHWVHDVEVFVENGYNVAPFVNGRHCLAAVFISAPELVELRERCNKIRSLPLFNVS